MKGFCRSSKTFFSINQIPFSLNSPQNPLPLSISCCPDRVDASKKRMIMVDGVQTSNTANFFGFSPKFKVENVEPTKVTFCLGNSIVNFFRIDCVRIIYSNNISTTKKHYIFIIHICLPPILCGTDLRTFSGICQCFCFLSSVQCFRSCRNSFNFLVVCHFMLFTSALWRGL